MGGGTTKTLRVERALLGTTIALDATIMGADASIALSGGVAHVGCTVLSQARPSLTGSGATSATTSVINVIGHKDDEICRMVAEGLCKRTGGTVVCSGGIHIDDATPSQIREVGTIIETMVEELVGSWEDPCPPAPNAPA